MGGGGHRQSILAAGTPLSPKPPQSGGSGYGSNGAMPSSSSPRPSAAAGASAIGRGGSVMATPAVTSIVGNSAVRHRLSTQSVASSNAVEPPETPIATRGPTVAPTSTEEGYLAAGGASPSHPNLPPVAVVAFPPGAESFLERMVANEAALVAAATAAIDDEFDNEVVKSRRAQLLCGQAARRRKFDAIDDANEREIKSLLEGLSDAIRDRETTLRADGYQTFLFGNEFLYEGDWKNSRMHGRGVMRSADGQQIYEGEWFLGLRNGQGTLHALDANTTYDGKWSDGKKHGKGELTEPEGVYRGEFRAGRIQGLGEYIYNDGHVYRGEWLREAYHGNGVYTFPTGTRYDGGWREGAEHGRGTRIYRNGDIYSGEWASGRRHGTGTLTTAALQYEGQWEFDHIEGKGTCRYADGSHYTGGWSKGQHHGRGELVDAKGRTYTGEFCYGKRHGEGSYEGEGIAYTGPWRADKKEGAEGSMAFVSGGVYTGPWVDDLPHGKGVFDTATGVRDRVVYSRGKCVERDDSVSFKKFSAELEINMILSPEAERKSRFAAKKRKEALEQEKALLHMQTAAMQTPQAGALGAGASPQSPSIFGFGPTESSRASFM